MTQPILVVMAAGMGSRYGGLKQLDSVGPNGEVIMDYSIFDAIEAGFQRVIFIIKKEIQELFQEKIGNRLEKQIQVQYAYQEISDLPKGYTVPDGRVKPWGTAHAILSARHLIDAPFAVINADDYYGKECFQVIYRYLSDHSDDNYYRYCMVAYQIQNTVTVNGSVSRGVCRITSDDYLSSITEHTRIKTCPQGIRSFYEEQWTDLPNKTPVSMNLWGFTPSFLTELKAGFPLFLEQAQKDNPLKAEYFLPSVVSHLIQEKKAKVKVLYSQDQWHGVTYQADKNDVVQFLQKMTESGCYPTPLWKS